MSVSAITPFELVKVFAEGYGFRLFASSCTDGEREEYRMYRMYGMNRCYSFMKPHFFPPFPPFPFLAVGSQL